MVVSFYYRQRTIQSTKQSIKQQEQKNATLRQHQASPQMEISGKILLTFIFVFTSQKLAFMLQTAHRAEQKTSPSQLFGIFTKCVSTRTKGEINKIAQMRGTVRYIPSSTLFFA